MEYFVEDLSETEEFKKDPPVCQPYLQMDIAPDASMLVEKFETNCVTLSRQFAEGLIDQRLIPKLARVIAAINSTDLDEAKEFFALDYNDGVKHTFRNMCPTLKLGFGQLISQPRNPQNQHFLDYAHTLGQEMFDKMMDIMLEGYERPEVLLHGDVTIFNTLVESTIQNGDSMSFGRHACLKLCDWDMSHVGNRGRDIGSLLAAPIAYAYFLAAQGQPEKGLACIDSVFALWKEYYKCMTAPSQLNNNNPKTDSYMLELYRACIGWCGIYIVCANAIVKAQVEFFPFDKVSEESGMMAMSSYTITGIKAMEWGFLVEERDPHFTLPELKTWFRSAIMEQFDFLLEQSGA
mmetsp:Transcript_5445/g.10236  ORF Transcript_5445/g.10236 Transcript_5445/m.10236 type:complete len:349 (+) Transcript_5445:3-1049(+)